MPEETANGLTISALGRVEAADPLKIRWNSRDPEVVDLNIVPLGLTEVPVGTWIDAEIIIDRARGNCLRVLSFEPTESWDEPATSQTTDPSEGFDSMEKLPKGEWSDL